MGCGTDFGRNKRNKYNHECDYTQCERCQQKIHTMTSFEKHDAICKEYCQKFESSLAELSNLNISSQRNEESMVDDSALSQDISAVSEKSFYTPYRQVKIISIKKC